jgi:hypothetical protein
MVPTHAPGGDTMGRSAQLTRITGTVGPMRHAGITPRAISPWADARQQAGAWCVRAAFGACLAVAPLLAVLDALLRPVRTRRAWRGLRAGAVHPARALRDLWFTRAAREALRGLMAAGMTDAVLARVVLAGNVAALDRGAVLAACHSPWGRVLAAWMAHDGRVAMLATRRWSSRAGAAHEPADRRGLRRAIGRLRAGRCMVVTVDHFTVLGACRATILGRAARACTGAARIAARARVPIVPVVVRYRAGCLEIVLGDAIPAALDQVEDAMAATLATFDRAIARDPSTWADALRWVSAPAPRR